MRRRAFLLSLPISAFAIPALAAEAGQFVNLTGSADMTRLRDKEPFFRDALVRAAHRTPFTRFDDYTKLDEAKLKAALLQAGNVIAGPGSIASSQIMPGGGPMRRNGLPTPKLAPH